MTKENLDTVNIATLYERLASHGFSKEYIWDNFLPDWWCDEFEQEEERCCSGISCLCLLTYRARL